MRLIKFDAALIALDEIQSVIIGCNEDKYYLSFMFRNSSNGLKIYVSDQENAEKCLNDVCASLEKI